MLICDISSRHLKIVLPFIHAKILFKYLLNLKNPLEQKNASIDAHLLGQWEMNWEDPISESELSDFINSYTKCLLKTINQTYLRNVPINLPV